MSSKIHLLRETIKLLIAEQTQQSSLGFTIVKAARGMIIGVVFDTSNILLTIKTDRNITKHANDLNSETINPYATRLAKQGLEDSFKYVFTQVFYDSIVAMVAVEPPLYNCADAYEIKLAAGPREREIIADMLAHMSSFTGTNTYIADREFVSPEGRAAWWLMSPLAQKKIPLDNVEHPPKGEDPFHDKHHTSSIWDDCSTYPSSPGDKKDRTLDAINHALTVKPTGKHNMQSYENNAKGLFRQISNLHGPISGLFDIIGPIESATMMYFEQHFKSLSHKSNNMNPSPYTYKATIKRVVDGDTVIVDIDLGFHITIKDHPLRMARVNAPEKKGATLAAGTKSTNALKEKLEGKEVVIHTYKTGEDKYGRLLADVFLGDECINDWLLKEGHAVSFMVLCNTYCMLNHKIYLKRLYTKLLREAAEESQAGDKIINPFSDNDIAFYNFTDNLGYKKGVCYKSKNLVDTILADIDTWGVDSSSVRAALEKSVIAYIAIAKPTHPCNGAWEVNRAAGQGKLAYAMGYYLSPSNTLIPDRSSLSGKAIKAWKNYSKKSEGKPLDDVSHDNKDFVSDPFHDKYHTKEEGDDCNTWPIKPDASNQDQQIKQGDAVDPETSNVINRSYKSNSNTDFSPLAQTHQSTLSFFEKRLNFSKENFIEELKEAGESFFWDLYRLPHHSNTRQVDTQTIPRAHEGTCAPAPARDTTHEHGKCLTGARQATNCATRCTGHDWEGNRKWGGELSPVSRAPLTHRSHRCEGHMSCIEGGLAVCSMNVLPHGNSIVMMGPDSLLTWKP